MTHRILFIANLNHNYDSLLKLSRSHELNVTELFGAINLPLGILSIDSYLKKICPGIHTQILDLNAEFLLHITEGDLNQNLYNVTKHFDRFFLEKIWRAIENFHPEVIAISSLFDKSIPTLLWMAENIKQRFPDTLIIAGGHSVNNLYEDILSKSGGSIDAISFGEGEIPFSELMAEADIKKHLRDSAYFLTKEEFENHEPYIPQYAYIEDLDDIPIYDYDSYLDHYGERILTLHNNILDANHSFSKQAVMMTSRGCPYQCIFCASRQIHGQKMRKNSMERVRQEIDYWVKKRQADTIGFFDDHILFDVNRTIQICDYAGTYGTDIRFPNGLAVSCINKELVEAFSRNKVREVYLALESGSARVLKEIIHKPLSIPKAAEVFELFKNTDIFVRVYLVLGFPNETKADVEDALSFLRHAYFNWASISIPTPISGSDLLEMSLKNGYLKEYDYRKVSFYENLYDNTELEEAYNGDVRYTVNLDVNFVHNPYMRYGKYDLAKQRFDSILKNYPNHAFAYYFKYLCMKHLGYPSSEMEKVRKRYHEIVSTDKKWNMYAEYFRLNEI